MTVQKVPFGHIDVGDSLAIATLTDAATIVVDWSAFNVAQVNLTANRVLGAPSNTVPGSTRYIFVRTTSGTRTLTFNTNYKGEIPTLADITSTKWYLLTLVCYSSSHIVISSVRAL
jgi:hypothetical protein